MPRPRVVLSLLFVLLVAGVGLRPAVVVLGSPRHAAQSTPTPNWLPADRQGRLDALGRGLPLSAQVWTNHNTGR